LYIAHLFQNLTMFIHNALCISPQHTYPEVDLSRLRAPENGFLSVIDPGPGRIDRNAARRMSKPVRMGMTLAMDMLSAGFTIDGLIFATASAGNAAAMQFLKQISEYDEGLLTPGDFVQSSPHALAGQIASVLHTNCYTNTHVHGGSSFEHALTDAMLLLQEKPGAQLLVGAMDEFSDYNHRIHIKGGWYDDRDGRNARREDGRSAVGGEGCAMFHVNDVAEGAKARIVSVLTFHSNDTAHVAARADEWLCQELGTERAPIALLTGVTEDSVTKPVYDAVIGVMPQGSSVHPYKHLCGEYPTAGAFALWLALQPGYLDRSHVLVHHAYKGLHQSLVLVEIC
jgi:hypothetical protein